MQSCTPVQVTVDCNMFRGKTFVIAFGGKAIMGPLAWTLAYDVNLLAALGIRLVLVHGARPQIEEELREKGLESKYHGRYRITDAAALDCVIDAVGSVYLELEAMLSQGLPDTPMANSTIRVIGGNFITARPVGVIDGVDLQYAGAVRKVDAEGIRAQPVFGARRRQPVGRRRHGAHRCGDARVLRAAVHPRRSGRGGPRGARESGGGCRAAGGPQAGTASG